MRIEPAELERVFPIETGRDSGETLRETTRNIARPAELVARVAELEARLAERDERLREGHGTIEDLRRRLDTATAQLGEALTQVRLLTDQRTAPAAPVAPPRARRSWWRWGRKLGIAVAVWGAACGSVLAAETGNTLLEDCLKPVGSSGRAYCTGYVTGVTEALYWAGDRGRDGSACVPDEVTLGQMVDVVVRFLQIHPEVRHHAAIIVVRAALGAAFPCPR